MGASGHERYSWRTRQANSSAYSSPVANGIWYFSMSSRTHCSTWQRRTHTSPCLQHTDSSFCCAKLGLSLLQRTLQTRRFLTTASCCKLGSLELLRLGLHRVAHVTCCLQNMYFDQHAYAPPCDGIGMCALTQR